MTHDEAKALVERLGQAKSNLVLCAQAIAMINRQTREIERLEADNARLRELLTRVLPYVATQAVGCHGDKCRKAWCYSCNDEDEAQIAASIARTAYRDARAALQETSHDA